MNMRTNATCGLACWQAREDVCRCSCEGANHGIEVTGVGQHPQRTKQVRGVRYHLIAVGTYSEAMRVIDSHRRLESRDYDRYIQNEATESQYRWEEVDNVTIPLDSRGRAQELHLVWERG